MMASTGLHWTAGFIVGAAVHDLLGWIAVAIWTVLCLAALAVKSQPEGD